MPFLFHFRNKFYTPQSTYDYRGYWLRRNLDKNKCGTHLRMDKWVLLYDGKETMLNLFFFFQGKKVMFCLCLYTYIWMLSLCKYQGALFLSVKPVSKLFKMRIRSQRFHLALLLQQPQTALQYLRPTVLPKEVWESMCLNNFFSLVGNINFLLMIGIGYWVVISSVKNNGNIE